jgi:hypothetical protein
MDAYAAKKLLIGLGLQIFVLASEVCHKVVFHEEEICHDQPSHGARLLQVSSFDGLGYKPIPIIRDANAP